MSNAPVERPIDQAYRWAVRLHVAEMRGPHDIVTSMRRLSRKVGVPYTLLWRLRYRAPKDIYATWYFALQKAYNKLCEDQLKKARKEYEITGKLSAIDRASLRQIGALLYEDTGET